MTTTKAKSNKKSAKPAAGRPALPPDQQRTERVTVRMTRDELAAIADQLHSRTVAEGIREMALRSANKNQNDMTVNPTQLKRIIQTAVEKAVNEVLAEIKT